MVDLRQRVVPVSHADEKEHRRLLAIAVNNPPIFDAILTLDNIATPEVALGNVWRTGGTTTITNFTGGTVGQWIEIISDHAITINDNSNIVLSGGANFVMKATDTLTLRMYDADVWTETSRSVN